MIKLRIIAWILLVNFLTGILAPTAVYALTAGPTSPDFSSFEPVDTTDMVNLNTGDFTYSIPLLEVPGPEGGYPMALSYHAGISPEQESSWVGLGWTLNPGAINRMVNGFPDDINKSSTLIHDTWDGGTSITRSISVGYGSSVLGASVGVTYGKDTYQGQGLGGDFNLGLRSSYGSLGIQFGMNPFGGEGYFSMGANIGIKGMGGVGVNLSTNDQAGGDVLKFGVGANVGGSLVGVSINSNSTEPTLRVLGNMASPSLGNSSGSLTVLSSSWHKDIPIWYGIYVGIGASKTRYFMDNIHQTFVFGSLYGSSILESEYTSASFDCYALPPVGDNTYYSNPDALMEGSLPSYDHYMVLGQGIGGFIQPYIYEPGALFRKGAGNVSFEYGNSFNKFNHGVGFRFVNDFSNSFTRDNVNNNYTTVEAYKNNITAKIGKDHKNYDDANIVDFNKDKGMLAGSKHVEWFTNQQINNYSQAIASSQNPSQHHLNGFIPSLDQRPSYLQVDGEYGQDANDNIGGFLVTNESGVSYHYSIPVYNFNDITKYQSSNGASRVMMKTLPYAYTWLLTGITGPDYVDRAPYGEVDKNDWGYWVKMEYGKWTDKYNWRTPVEGGTKDILSSTEVFSAGRKELYYLDAIKTRSHTALFLKDIKKDGKGVGSQELGGFGIHKDENGIVQSLPAASMKLNRVLLFSNRVLDQELAKIHNNTTSELGISSIKELKSQSSTLYHTYQNNAGHTVVVHNGKTVLDEADLNDDQTQISNHALRQIKFDYSPNYDLCQGTPNSFDVNYNNYTRSPSLAGKLTLNAVEILGVNGKKIIPTTEFDYALKNIAYNKDAIDAWGLYKSDYTLNETDRKRTPQYTTLESAKYKHAWSLNKISTPLGSTVQIEYETDYYNNPVLMPKKNIAIKSLNYIGNAQYELELYSTELLENIVELSNELVNNMEVHLLHKAFARSGPPPSSDDRTQMPLNRLMSLDNSVVVVPEAIELDEARNLLIITSHNLEENFTKPYYTTFDPENPNFHVHEWTFGFGNILLNRLTDHDIPGGSIRVKSIALRTDNVENIKSYTYINGTMAMEPVDINIHINMNEYHKPFDLQGAVTVNLSGGISRENIETYKNRIYKFYADVIANNSFLPPPEPMYESVIIQDKIRHYSSINQYIEIKGEGSAKLDFTVFDETMLPKYSGDENILSDNTRQRSITIKDFRNRIGLLKKVTKYTGSDATGNVLITMENNYFHRNTTNYENELESRYANQGRIDQVFFEKKQVGSQSRFLITKIEDHPVILNGTNVKDHKKNIFQEDVMLAYDFYSGDPLVTWTKDAWGNELLTENIPAYHVYPQMGHRINNVERKHMLSQQSATTSYKVQANTTTPKTALDYDKIGLFSAAVQTWSKGMKVLNSQITTGPGIIYQNGINYDQGLVWRKEATYSWVGDEEVLLNEDGLYPMAHFIPFDFNNPSTLGIWQKNSLITLTDTYSHLLETSDINDNYTTVLMDPRHQYITATASYAKYDEVAYSGCEFAEYYAVLSSPSNNTYEGRVALGQGVVVKDINRAHTGDYSLVVSSGQEGFTYSFIPEQARKYRASVWVYLPGSAEGLGNDQLDNVRLAYRVKGTNIILNKTGEGYRKTTKKARSHYLLTLEINADQIPEINGNIPELEVVCMNIDADRSVYFDDFRCSPLESDFTSYIYNIDRGLLTHTLDNDNLYTRFEYDEMGTLTTTYSEIFAPVEKKVVERRYHYAGKQQ